MMHRHVPLDHLPYANRWRRRHPAEKGLLALGLLLVTLVLPPVPTSVLALLAASLIGMLGARIPVRAWSRLLGAQSVFLGGAWAALAWQSGWQNGAAMALRSLAATACLLLLALTTPVPALLSCAGRWAPLRPLADLAALIYRFLATGIGTMQRSRAGVRQRLGHPRAWKDRALHGDLAARVLHRLLDRSTGMERGYQCRGVDGLLPYYNAHQPLEGRYVAAALLLQAGLLAGGIFLW